MMQKPLRAGVKEHTMSKYSIGLDFGTNSVRAIVVDVSDGREAGSAVWNYAHGSNGIILGKDPTMARQHPADYIEGTRVSICEALADARKTVKRFSPAQVIGIGVDTTGSTPFPVDANGMPLALKRQFRNNPDSMAWLWKDHTSVAEAHEITQLARKRRPEYLAKCGGVYSSEWFFSKILHCLRANPKIFKAAHSWVELADWIPALLTDTQSPDKFKIGICAAGHKAMYHQQWGGYPDKRFLGALDPELASLRERINREAVDVSCAVGGLSGDWAKATGLTEGIPVAAGAFDCHMGAIGAGIVPGTLVKIIGTSSCDIMIHPMSRPLDDIPGLCGIVPSSVLPNHYGLEAGQSAVGDIFNWFVNCIRPGGEKGSHEALTAQASKLVPGESGLLALDWNNGNRTVLVDQQLTGMLIGQTLHTTGAEVYRTLIESTAFGALTIINQFETHGLKVKRLINCGGIAQKNPLVMQIYADVTGRRMQISRSAQTCALGAAIAGAVVAGKKAGGYAGFPSAQKAMTGVKPKQYLPNPKAVAVYRKLFALYTQMHDSMGRPDHNGAMYNVMKDLLAIRAQARMC